MQLRQVVSLTVLPVVLVSCSGSESPTQPPAPVATSITLSPTTLSFSALGAAQQLTATVTDQKGAVMASASVTWVSSNQAVATASPSGLVTSVGNGTATITAASGGASASATVTVQFLLGVGFGAEQFILIQPGTFLMGSADGASDERPVHAVNITKAFYLQKTEATQSQWKAVMGSNPSYFTSCGDDCPVERVSWNTIQEFIAKLNQANPGMNYRLPTEAEWEYAARAGTAGDYGGNGVLNDMGWWSGNSGGHTQRVARKLPSAWGLYDMHGNVWEWVQDWYSSSYYSVSPTNGPTGPTNGSDRVVRGGSFEGYAVTARSANRGSISPSTGDRLGVGFRLARTP